MMWDRDRGWVPQVWTQDLMASGPSKFQEIEPLEGDDNQQACKTALMKVECHHFGCDWKLEECPDVVQIWIQDHMDTEHDGVFPEIELLEEDKNRQACKTALAKVKCQHQGCDWEEELYPEVADIWIQDHVDTVHGGSQYIGPGAGRSKPQEIVLPEEDKNHQACGTALERDIKLAGTLT